LDFRTIAVCSEQTIASRRTKEVSVRKITAGLFVSLDGVVESPEKWQLPYFNDEMGEAVGLAMAAADAMLLGRVTYQEFASYWPGVSSEEQPFAGYMNDTPKYVVSTTLDTVGWNNSTLIKGNVAEEITRLKQQPGKNIGITGSATLVQSLVRDDLLDELGLMVHPVVVGRGKRLFENGGSPKGLKLVDSKTFSTGVVYLTYQPAGKEEEG
jgi:dihydrofolate reductase